MTAETEKPFDVPAWLRDMGSLLSVVEADVWRYRAAADLIEQQAAEIARLESQLPDGMKDCFIQFVECPQGHGRLTASNWLDRSGHAGSVAGCHWCRIAELEEQVAWRDTTLAAAEAGQQTLQRRIAELETRLELTADDGTRIEIGECDGIGCRDETIRLLMAELNRRREDIDKYEYLMATAYQLAGLVGAPTRFLDSYALVGQSVDPDTLLPVTLDELDEFARLQAELSKVRAERDNAVRERDLAIAHDRQPYPTAWAYEQVCKARDSLQRECEGLRKEVERWKQQPNPGHPRGCICVRCEDARATLSPAEPQEPVVSHESTTNLVVAHETGNRDTQAQEPEPAGEPAPVEVASDRTPNCVRCQRGERRCYNISAGYGHRVCPHFFLPCGEGCGESVCCERQEAEGRQEGEGR